MFLTSMILAHIQTLEPPEVLENELGSGHAMGFRDPISSAEIASKPSFCRR